MVLQIVSTVNENYLYPIQQNSVELFASGGMLSIAHAAQAMTSSDEKSSLLTSIVQVLKQKKASAWNLKGTSATH